MESAVQSVPSSKAKVWTSRTLSTIAILFLLFDSVIHLLAIAPVVDAFTKLGIPVNLALGVGIVELACVALYIIPGTSVSGAILLTGYLGGAVAIQLRIGAPLFSTALFPIYVGILVWGGLYLREGRLRTLVPLRRSE